MPGRNRTVVQYNGSILCVLETIDAISPLKAFKVGLQTSSCEGCVKTENDEGQIKNYSVKTTVLCHSICNYGITFHLTTVKMTETKQQSKPKGRGKGGISAQREDITRKFGAFRHQKVLQVTQRGLREVSFTIDYVVEGTNQLYKSNIQKWLC